jgi:deoxycytidylate deaminase
MVDQKKKKRSRRQQQDLMAFAYDKRGRLISTGKNSYIKTHPVQARYAKKAGLPNKVYMHAELDALLRARGTKVHKMVVIRIGKDGSYMKAKPCEGCQLALKDFGVREIEHT